MPSDSAFESQGGTYRIEREGEVLVRVSRELLDELVDGDGHGPVLLVGANESEDGTYELWFRRTPLMVTPAEAKTIADAYFSGLPEDLERAEPIIKRLAEAGDAAQEQAS